MTIKSYINLYELLQKKDVTHEENRAFGMSHVLLKNKPLKQLLAWSNEHTHTLSSPSLGERFSSYLYGITLILVLVAFLLGFLSGLALLSYSGDEPVNVVYFIVMVVFFPLLTMLLTLFSMLRANAVQSALVHISPAFWMEKIVALLPNNIQEDLQTFKINPLLANWIVIKRSQVIALVFSLGLLFALLFMVISKDIAFSWSTTLDVSHQSFHAFLNTIAFGWRDIFPSAVPSVELIQSSQYFRLGDKLSDVMVANASKLGEWWKFLVMATIFYAIILRFFFYILALFGYKQAMKKSLFSLEGASTLLEEMNVPIISTHADTKEERFVTGESDYKQVITQLDSTYDTVHGWAISQESLSVFGDSVGIVSPFYIEVGGANSFAEDQEAIAKSKGDVLFVVKGWEPPTMDFVDYLHELGQKVDRIVLLPIGTAENHYIIKETAVDVWDRKLSKINEDKVWLKR